MKINTISICQNKNTFCKLSKERNKNTTLTNKNEIVSIFNIPFKGKPIIKQKTISIQDYEKRMKYLCNSLGICDDCAKRIANFEKKSYERAVELIKKEIDETIAESIAILPDEKYEQAKNLLTMDVKDESLSDLAKLDEEEFIKAKKFLKEDFKGNVVSILINLSDEQIEKVLEYMKKGEPPYVAAMLASLNNDEERIFALDLYKEGYSIEISTEIAEAPPKKRKIYVKNLKKGIDENSVIEIGNLKKKEKERIQELIDMNIGDNNIADFAKLSQEDYDEIKKMMNDGTLPENAYDFLVLKKDNKINPNLQSMLDKGYGLNSALSIDMMPTGEKEILEKIKENFPEIENFFKENYDVEVSVMEFEDKAELLLSKQITKPNQNKITFHKIFDTDGNQKDSRLEEFEDFSTSSTSKNGDKKFKLTYLKGGDIKEMIEYVYDKENKSVEGVYYSKASSTLKGCFETTYYDINEFKTGRNDELSDKQVIPECVNSAGIELSKVEKLEDGTIFFTESFERNSLLTEREYSEKNDYNGNITEKSYKYQISDKDGNIKLNIDREWTKLDENTVKNTINGNTYILKFDDDKKIITIESDGYEKILNFNRKLAKCSKENLWDIIKKLDIDTLLTIYKNVKKWYHCQDEESVADGLPQELSTGNDLQIIAHETGHFKTYEKTQDIENNIDLQKTYLKEMKIFEDEIPYNEKEFIEYFSQRSDLCESEGFNEFMAETNMLLTSYGHKRNQLKTRGQLLVRYFPETIAKFAEVLEKNSTKNLLYEE